MECGSKAAHSGRRPRSITVRILYFAFVLSLLCSPVGATMVFEQPPDPAGGVLISSWYFPDGTDYDMYVYDSFQLASSQPITEVRWRGGYQYTGYGLLNNFSITFYESIAGGSQPHCGLPGDGDIFLATYEVGGTAGETPAGVYGGIQMYDYHYALPQPFQAAAGVKYWIRIEGYTAGLPFWGIAVGTGGNNQHFRYMTGAHQFSFGQHDAAFSLHTTGGATYQIATSVSPAGAGTTTGDGAYPPGSTATVVATQNAGWGFVNWTENGVPVSNSARYSFTVDADRTLVANFMTAYTVVTSAQPVLGGTTSGDGVYNAGSTVTVVASPKLGYDFVNWTENGVPVSTLPSYEFIASTDRTLVANFTLGAGAVLFDFDNAPIHTSLPIDLTVGGLTAHLSATGGGFSIQRADAMGFTPAGFAGLCVYPNTIFAADLQVDFSQALTDFSIMYSPQELGCDDSATMRVTAYMDGAYVGTNTTTAFPPGTWPTGTLTFGSTQSFNRVVVHYDAPPPTCQDYGVIFMADNMIVTVAGNPATVAGIERGAMVPVISPNPFGGETTIRFGLFHTAAASVTVHDLQGRLVRTLIAGSDLAAGIRDVRWDGRDDGGREVASGIYLCRVRAGTEAASGSMILLRSR
jgi:hypothetical protein